MTGIVSSVAQHPLDPLSAAEIKAAAACVRAFRQTPETVRFNSISLQVNGSRFCSQWTCTTCHVQHATDRAIGGVLGSQHRCRSCACRIQFGTAAGATVCTCSATCATCCRHGSANPIASERSMLDKILDSFFALIALTERQSGPTEATCHTLSASAITFKP